MLAAAAPHFRAAGYETHILSTGQQPGEFAPVLERAGCVIHHLPFAREAGFFRAFHGLVAQQRPDIVHVHCERAAVLYAALAAPSARVVRTVHGYFDFTGWLRRRKTAERWFCRRALGVVHIAPGPSVRDNELLRFANETRLCCNWYDDARFNPPTDAERRDARQALGFAPDDVAVISVGAHAPVKNLSCALQAFARLRDDRRLRFLHVGRPVDPETGDSLPQQAAALGLSGVARFIGETDDVPRYLHAADIHLMPSWREGLGMAAVEAMAAGLPQILADVPGLADFRGLAPGVVHTSPTVDDVARAIAAMAATTGAARRGWGAEIAAATRRTFSTAAGAARYVGIYDACAGPTAPTTRRP